MANIKSSLKRIDITKRNTLRNKQCSSKIKTFTKNYLISIEKYKLDPNEISLNFVRKNLNMAFSQIDKASKSKVLHKNTAARKKSALHFVFHSINL